LAGIRETKEDALKLILGESLLEAFTRQEDVESFADGRDSLPDLPVSFASDKRLFSSRRIRTVQGKQ